MKIGIGYSYLNGEKEHSRALDPWYPHVDHIIAIDGRYKTPLSPAMRLHPMPDYSTDHSYRVLRKRYGKKLTHERFVGTQMEKRQRYLDIAGDLGCDFLIVWDSDDYIHPDYQDWTKFMKQLQVTEYWDDELFNMWAWIPDERLWSRQHNAVPSNYWMKYVRVHKNPGQMRYVWDHWHFAKKDVPIEEINQWDFDHTVEPGLSPLENPLILKSNMVLDGIRITTDRTLRTPSQLTFGDGWAWQNLHDENWTNLVIPTARHAGLSRYVEDKREYYFNEKGQRVIYQDDGTTTIDPLVITDGEVVTS